MCTHVFRDVDGHKTCVECGLVSDRILTTDCFSFSQSHHRVKRITRIDRFIRHCKNLCGFQKVSEIIIRACEHCETFKHLVEHLRLTNKKMVSKAPSIWRALGNHYAGLQPREYERLRMLFIAERAASFLVIVPFLLQKINRDDLLMYTKTPSAFVQDKYNMFIK